MNDAEANRILQYLGGAVETCEKDTSDILSVTISLDMGDVEYNYEWNGEKFVHTTLKRKVV
jgi:hypothetical protein